MTIGRWRALCIGNLAASLLCGVLGWWSIGIAHAVWGTNCAVIVMLTPKSD